jgi:hypothetical protein
VEALFSGAAEEASFCLATALGPTGALPLAYDDEELDPVTEPLFSGAAEDISAFCVVESEPTGALPLTYDDVELVPLVGWPFRVLVCEESCVPIPVPDALLS